MASIAPKNLDKGREVDDNPLLKSTHVSARLPRVS
jgi:hypothetical protein